MVRLTPNASDDGRLLACRAENRNLPTAVIEDTWKLSVYYTPTAEAMLGASLNPQNIREGDDVYFECHVKANPRAYKVVWKHNPEAPTNCSLYNVSASSLTVACMPGFDGGLNQTFAMEVYGTSPHSLKANITNNHPRFMVTGLDNESEFQLIVYAGNSKGRSSITRLVAITHKLPVKQLETRLSNSGNDGNYHG
ncbi:Kin of IRRE-like protein 2 [Portunus trituberculatus]|uniref:Kin of IRRE-like protein 2 n=1 Tax=Portunus trituberculatus TaxID=210409 RepID=A0A5B7FXD1_PORTR|nr:Kin of IRRE-like protein 2 [Portunus trituberculatus]